ncbi:uncharacterized protein [Diadema antillarum]|uniref:uncharacterized protein n=1 Tax=Diadema antillarum TaxID=105358 RepID=UPI003A8B7589
MSMETKRHTTWTCSRAVSVHFRELEECTALKSLLIICNVDVNGQPNPYIHTYEIEVDETTLSSSNSSVALLAPRPNKCIDVSCTVSNDIGSSTSSTNFCPHGTRRKQQQQQLTITCHIDPVHQSPIPIDSYTIEIDDVVVSSSDAPYAVFTSRSDRCINVVCTGRNALGDVLDIEFEELVGEDYRNVLSISCHVEDRYQPTPPINTFLITASGRILSSSNSSSVTLDPRPETCTRVTCTGQNDFGSTTKSRTFCPTVIADINPWQHSKGFIQEPSTTGALIVVVLVLSMAACFAFFMKRKHHSADMMN